MLDVNKLTFSDLFGPESVWTPPRGSDANLRFNALNRRDNIAREYLGILPVHLSEAQIKFYENHKMHPSHFVGVRGRFGLGFIALEDKLITEKFIVGKKPLQQFNVTWGWRWDGITPVPTNDEFVHGITSPYEMCMGIPPGTEDNIVIAWQQTAVQQGVEFLPEELHRHHRDKMIKEMSIIKESGRL